VNFVLNRVSANGVRDTAFGTDGVVSTNLIPERGPDEFSFRHRHGRRGSRPMERSSPRVRPRVSSRSRVHLGDSGGGGGPTDPTTPAIAITGGVLVASGTGGADTITVRRTGQRRRDRDGEQSFASVRHGRLRRRRAPRRLRRDDRITVVDSLSTPVSRRVTIVGGPGNDTLTGNDGADLIQGGGGRRLARRRPGNDTLDGGDGTDFADGDGGQNTHISIEQFAGGGTVTASDRHRQPRADRDGY
jgi:Ca2+-binding RTX toxin-like protein